jgi:hypothetical protein
MHSSQQQRNGTKLLPYLQLSVIITPAVMKYIQRKHKNYQRAEPDQLLLIRISDRKAQRTKKIFHSVTSSGLSDITIAPPIKPCLRLSGKV